MHEFRYRLWVILSVLLTVSCVHEYPEDYGGIDPTEIDTKITLRTEQKFTHTSIASSRAEESFDFMYFIVELHEDEYGATPLFRREIGVQKFLDGSTAIELHEKLHAGHYKCVAYAMAANSTDGTGRIFQTSDLSNIGYSGSYPGNTDAKECYETRFDIDLSPSEWYASTEVTNLLNTPMGSVEVISTDVNEFIQNEISRNEANAAPGDDTRVDLWQWDDYYVVWKYDQYYPVRYNLYTGLPNQALREVSFRATIVPQSDTEASLGFDYIFVNGQTSQVSLTLEVYDKNNTRLNVYSGIKVPIERGRTTVIRGEYLTNRQESGVGIDPGFDGDISVELPD